MKQEFGWHKYIPVLLFSLLPAMAGAQPIVWTTGSLQRTGPTDAAGRSTYVQVSAGRGEYESFQIVVQSPSSGLSNVNVSVSNLNGPGGAVIPSTAFTLYREQYVYVNQSSPNWNGTNQPLGAGWYPDGLIPFNDPSTGLPITGATIEAVPFSLSAARNQPIWVDLLVPRNAVPGAYTGTYTVTSDQGSITGTIALTVWRFTLPLQPSLHSSFLYWTADSLASEEELLRNKLSPIRTDPGAQSGLIGNYGLESVGLPFFSGADVSDCTMSAAPSVSDFASAAASEQPGLYQYDYSADEIGSCPTLFPTLQQWAQNMHKAGIRNLVTMSPNPALYDDGSGTGRSAVDIWTMLPIGYDAAASQMPVVLAKGDSLWSYNAVVQDSYSPKWMIDFAPINFRIQPGFISQSLNLTGLLYWRVDDWSSDPWNQVNNAGTFSTNNYPGEGMLVYPGAQVGISGVAPSMRLKWMRDGVDDYEYVQMLKNAGQGTFALGLAASVGANWSMWTQDPNQLASVRMQLGQTLDQLSAPPAAVTIPSPAAGATNASTAPSLSWAAGAGATSYSVYFGTTTSPALAGTTSGTSFTPGTLTAGTTYYWSVTAMNANGSAPSATWSFTTQVPAPAAPAGLSSAGATGVSVTPTLTWNASSGATSYGLYFGTSTSPSLVATVTGTSFSPGSLSNNTTYYWSVAAMNAAGSAMSAVSSFTTIVALPSAPSGLSPSGASGTSIAPTLVWNASSGAASYGVYFGTSASPSLVATVTGTSFSPGSLSNNTTYYWRVVATNAAGSATSAVSSFTTMVALPPAPSGLSPASATGVSVTPTVSWSASSGATSYGVHFGTSASPSLVATVSSTSFSPGSLSNNTTYYWSVVATNAAGSATSAVSSFTTIVALPSAPSGLSPSGTSGTSIAPTLVWNASSGAASYGVYFGTSASPSLVATVSSTSFSPGSLSNNTTYYWRVVATNAAGSATSAAASFTTIAALPSAPSGLSPASATGVSVTPTVSWSASSGATSYGVYFGTSASPALVATVTGTSFSPGSLSNNTTYYWRVVATNAAGSATSAASSFTTIAALPSAPSGLSPSGASGTSIAPTLVWSASSGATSYGVYFGTSASPSLVATVSSTSYAPPTLKNNTIYYWKVVAINAAGATTSTVSSFTTIVALPSAPSNPSPANGGTGVSTTPALTWSAGAGATSYSVFFGSSSSPALVATVSGTSYTPGTLTAGATYYWSVVAGNAAGKASSPTWSFTTAAPVTPNVTTASNAPPSVNSVTPSSGGGTTVSFQIGISDANGSGDLSGAGALINTSVNGVSACWFYYDLSGNSISLASDSTATWSEIPLGSPSTIGNSQCSITGTGVNVVTSQSNATLTVTVTFKPQAFAGPKNIYTIALNKAGLSSGYQALGTWIVQ